jgi:subtilase family serine protease
MTLQGSLKYGAITLLIAVFAAVGPLTFAQQAEHEHNVPAGIQISRDLGRMNPSSEINITVHLKLNDKAAFDNAVEALYDPASPTFHKWMTNADLMKYAPSEAQREMVRQELRNNGLTVLNTDPIGFTIRAHGTIENVERAFNTEIHQFQYKSRSYRANVRDARLSGEAGNYVFTVAGLESHQVHPMAVRATNPRTQKAFPSVKASKALAAGGFPADVSTNECISPSTTFTAGTSPTTATYTGAVLDQNPNLICDYLPHQLWSALGLDDVFANGLTGAGQSIAIVEAFGYPTLLKDANAFAKLAGLPALSTSNFKIVYPTGKPNPQLGILLGWNVEIALDIDWSHTVAPGAKIVEVISGGQDAEDFQGSVLYVAEHGLANTISNSYENDTDLIAGPLEQTAWDNVLEITTAKGISANFATGDSGDDGLGTPLGAPGVPSVSPHATAVGGTSILNDINNPGATVTTGWGDSLSFLFADGVLDPPEPLGFDGGGGGGESVFFAKPSWQSALPGKGRQTPDVSALSDPNTGVPIVLTVGTTQFIEFGWGGTSLGTPIFSGFWAIANEKAGHALGQAARAIAALPYGAIQDVLPVTDDSADNATASITDSNGTTNYSAAQLFNGVLEGNKNFTSALWPIDSEDLLVFGFGLDSSFIVRHGWDNATGFGTPHGMTFINAVAK